MEDHFGELSDLFRHLVMCFLVHFSRIFCLSAFSSSLGLFLADIQI